MHGRFIAIAASIVTAWALLPGPGAAQTYPAKPVRIIVPAQPGGGLDLIGRTVGEQLGRSMGQTFIIENVSGGGGAIASQAAARARSRTTPSRISPRSPSSAVRLTCWWSTPRSPPTT